MQPAGHIHAQGFLDQAHFFRHQFGRLGANVSIANNGLRHDAINFIFGAHTGFESHLSQRFRCVFVNLEQLGSGGASVSADYVRLLSESQVVDYDESNVAAYRGEGSAGPVPIITFAYAPYLAPDPHMPIETRPVDLLFFGSINERRHRLLQEIEAAGCKVSVLPFGVYGPARDHEIRKAKAVFNCHYYDSARFEQARVFQCLSLGTPVISERTATTSSPPQFENAVFWVGTNGIRAFFENDFRAPDFADTARHRLRDFANQDVLDQYVAALAHAGQAFAS
jgi:hypothetical protein